MYCRRIVLEKCLIFYRIKNVNPTIKSKFDEIVLCEGKTEVEVIKSLYDRLEKFICERAEKRKRIGVINMKGIGNLNKFIGFFTNLYDRGIVENNTLYIIMDKDLFDMFSFRSQCNGEGKLLECRSGPLRLIIALNYNEIEDEIQVFTDDRITHGDLIILTRGSKGAKDPFREGVDG
ncbi:hypothetical protein GO599_04230 [Sulfolobus islandicus]|uniref:TOPRIM nucleotidyl transferase/hydrolase domain-containing protein n=1 Tax=Saccharolobus islandicus TaxID=43080 RepID=UPI00069A9AC8|nr:TOPRIM nucleotidyl transferase/hydrolase domain-containing protein [Sulfolobus islandicus]WCM36761.1 hypothetical protein GO599_04230 [Sulfolobus islandicus]